MPTTTHAAEPAAALRPGSSGVILTNMNRSRPFPPRSRLLHCIRIAVVGLCLSLAAGTFPARADYRAGLDAFNAGAFEQAYAEWQKAALAGDKRAQHGLGLLLESGRGTKQDIAAARQWYEASAEQGFAAAMNNLAMMYAEGRGVDKDQGKAIAYWRQAADGGNATAQYNLGVQYMLGEGVTRDPAETAKLWTAAGNGNNVQAQYNLGLLYARGVGVAADDRQAAFWIAKAAEAGLAEAQIDLAELYRSGRGVTQNPDQAYYWLEKAAASGNLLARQRLTELPKPKTTVAREAQDASASETAVPAAPAEAAPDDGNAEAAAADSEPGDHGDQSAAAALVPVEGDLTAEQETADTAPATDEEASEAATATSPVPEADGQAASSTDAADTHEQVAETDETVAEATGMATVDVPEDGQDGATLPAAELGDAASEEVVAEEATGTEDEPVDGEVAEEAGEAEEAIEPEGVVALLPLGEILSPRAKVFRIWLGERNTPESARNEYSNLVGKYRPMLDNLAFEIRPFVVGSSEEGHHYRIYVGDFPALKDAQAMCDRIRARYSEQFCRSVIN
ncbi:TPR repeat protein [Dongia mobilis]|uniref:TPR repeat protein n=2 Tax=Dongia mobilis TaxID=578943 RepID=A0A4R6WPF8_9PROT|nr:TPR repeat protein [Dongia mobilis]